MKTNAFANNTNCLGNKQTRKGLGNKNIPLFHYRFSDLLSFALCVETTKLAHRQLTVPRCTANYPMQPRTPKYRSLLIRRKSSSKMFQVNVFLHVPSCMNSAKHAYSLAILHKPLQSAEAYLFFTPPFRSPCKTNHTFHPTP